MLFNCITVLLYNLYHILIQLITVLKKHISYTVNTVYNITVIPLGNDTSLNELYELNDFNVLDYLPYYQEFSEV